MEFWTKLASGMGLWAFSMSFLQILLPPDLRSSAAKLFHRLYDRLSSYCYYDIAEIDGFNTNDLYSSVKLYLSSIAAASGDRLTLARNPNSAAITFSLSNNNSIPDTFAGGSVRVEWEHVVVPRQSQTLSWRSLPEEKRRFVLRAHKRDKAAVLGAYLEHVTEKAKEIRRSNRELLLYTNSKSHSWDSVPFKHPSTFGTLAMDPKKKDEILADLKDFCNGQSFYRQTGRPWKRGYLLYGPPGTGKSSMIAAMANYLGYDIYDVELTEVDTNSDLRKLLIKTTSKSIIVIEDIDCSLNLTTTSRNKEVEIITWEGNPSSGPTPAAVPPPEKAETKSAITLSGLLNFTDGLWSCCGSERIFIFTTNHVERLDPALLRRGRMDMHIHMNYCSFPALKILVKNYLGLDVDEHGEGDAEALRELEGAIDDAEMTPADISEVLIKHTKDERTALCKLVEETRVRVDKRRSKNNTFRKEKCFGEVVFEDEEKEKREMPQSSYKKGFDEEEKRGEAIKLPLKSE